MNVLAPLLVAQALFRRNPRSLHEKSDGPVERLLVHGHCHRKAFGAMDSVERVLGWIPGVTVEQIDSGCCGLAGAFGYEAEHYDLSMRMAELSLLPAVRQADARTWIVADGTSCRRQILDGAGREAMHTAWVLAAAITADS